MTISPASADSYFQDASGYRGEAERVLLPETVEDIREIVRTCAASDIPLTVSGAGTGLTGARVPHGGWVVSLERFRKLEVYKGRARCGAGVLLRDLQNAAAASGQFLGPNPTENSAAVGGIIATNAGGARSFRYRAVRHHVLTLESTFMDGQTRRIEEGEKLDFPVRPVHVPATSKNAAGYNLTSNPQWIDLLAGSEGTLAIVTEADLRLLPEPGAILSGVVFFSSDNAALDAVDAWRSVPELRLLEFMDGPALKLLRPAYAEIPEEADAALLVEQNLQSEDDEEVDRWADRLREQRAFEEESWFGFRAADRERFRQFRHTLPAIVTDIVRRNGFSKFSTDFAVPIERHRELHAYYKRRCEETLPGKYTIFGHVGDANNHINLLPTSAEEASRGEALMYEFAEYVVRLGGTVAAEHGIGKNKTDLLALMYSPEELDSMKKVKRHLDPKWLLGRGTIFEVNG